MAGYSALLPGSSEWLAALRTYLAASAAGHLVWEVAQLPLYTIWRSGSAREIAFAVIHCTAGDVLVASSALTAALVLVGSAAWPLRHFGRVAAVALALGIAYTAFSEWLNVGIRQRWAYSELMPTLPWLEIGLSPLAQWAVVPSLALWRARRDAARMARA